MNMYARLSQLTTPLARHDRGVVWVLAATLLVVLALYLTFLLSTIFSVIARNQAERDIDTVRARLAEHERTYMNLATRVSMELAKEKGFVQVASPGYIRLDDRGDVLTFHSAR